MRNKKGLRGTLLSNCLMIIPLVLSACGSSFADNQLSKDTSMQLLSSDSQKKKDASSSENGSFIIGLTKEEGCLFFRKWFI